MPSSISVVWSGAAEHADCWCCATRGSEAAGTEADEQAKQTNNGESGLGANRALKYLGIRTLRDPRAPETKKPIRENRFDLKMAVQRKPYFEPI